MWTEAKTGRKIEARIADKKDDNSEVQVILMNDKPLWLKTLTLSPEDQAYVAAWTENAVKLTAKTVASSRKDLKWSETWYSSTADRKELLLLNSSTTIRDRVLAVEVANRGPEQPFVVEVFWLGFALNNKSDRRVCRMATKAITVPRGNPWMAAVDANFTFVDESCVYLTKDNADFAWEGFYSRTWSGYGYGGWAVRVSDGNGLLLAEQGSQTAFLSYIREIPVPSIRRAK